MRIEKLHENPSARRGLYISQYDWINKKTLCFTVTVGDEAQVRRDGHQYIVVASSFNFRRWEERRQVGRWWEEDPNPEFPAPFGTDSDAAATHMTTASRSFEDY
jgi:hypothetical protein